MSYKRYTEKRKGENVIPLLNAVCGVDLPEWKIAKESDIRQYLSGDAVNRLAELEDKIYNGTLIKLPCKVGDKAYYIDPFSHNDYCVDNAYVSHISISKTSTLWVEFTKENGCEDWYLAEDIGNEIFLSKEEAIEKAKKEGFEKKQC